MPGGAKTHQNGVVSTVILLKLLEIYDLDMKSKEKHLTPDGNGYYIIVLDEVAAAFSSKSQQEGG